MVSFLPGLALTKTTVLESMRTLSYFRLDTLFNGDTNILVLFFVCWLLGLFFSAPKLDHLVVSHNETKYDCIANRL